MRLVPLREVGSIQLGKMLSPKAKTGRESHPYLRNQNVQWGRFDLGELAVMDFHARDREKFELRDGDLLVCEGGEPGRCAVWRDAVKNCFYQKALHRVRPKPGAADPDFLALWIRLQALTGTFADQNAKTTIAHLPLVRLEQLLVPALEIQEQRDIAAHLKTQLAEVETARVAAQAKLREIAALPEKLLAQAFGDAA
ncbi:MAG: restriction endonuclease subunit S [Deferrisomatales bacterium]